MLTCTLVTWRTTMFSTASRAVSLCTTAGKGTCDGTKSSGMPSKVYTDTCDVTDSKLNVETCISLSASPSCRCGDQAGWAAIGRGAILVRAELLLLLSCLTR
eukprot:1518654-Amphidinium_carterae.1